MSISKRLIWVAVLLFTPMLFASPVYKVTASKPFAESLHLLKKSLENERLYIIAKADISGTLARMKGKLGASYNKRHYGKVESIIFCNPFYANEVLNADPDMMALCPLKIMLMEKNGKTTALFIRPTAIAGNSHARKTLNTVEQKVKHALRAAGFR